MNLRAQGKMLLKIEKLSTFSFTDGGQRLLFSKIIDNNNKKVLKSLMSSHNLDNLFESTTNYD